tara:strand:+ start:53083 stop:55506 length:2424 start_codon:yes stop_codon:yes gene_type:complete
VRALSLLLIFFFISSCASYAPVAQRFPASSAPVGFCKNMVRDLLLSRTHLSAPDLTEYIKKSKSLGGEYYLREIKSRDDKILKELFSSEELDSLKGLDLEFELDNLLKKVGFKEIDILHSVFTVSDEELEVIVKRLSSWEQENLLRLMTPEADEVFSSLPISLVVRRAGKKQRNTRAVVDVLENYFVSSGEATTKAKKKKAYKVVVNRPEVDFDESVIPKLIAFYRLSSDEFKAQVAKLTDEELLMWNETARTFNNKYQKVYFFDTLGENEILKAQSDLNYVFSVFTKEMRERERVAIELAEKAAKENAEANKDELKVLSDEALDSLLSEQPLTVKEDSFNFSDDFSDQDILLSFINLNGTKRLNLAPEPIKKILLEVAEESDEQKLLDEEVQSRIMKIFMEKLPEDDLNYVFGMSMKGTKELFEKAAKKSGWGEEKGPSNMHRGWAWRLLPDDDPAWKDPEYLAYSLKVTNASGGGLSAQDRNLYENIKYKFLDEWKKLDPNYRPVEFTTTGSDANNLLYSQALSAARAKHGREVKDAEILFFDQIYGGVRGKSAGMGYHRMGERAAQKLDDFKLPTARTYSMNPTDPDEIARLDKVEKEVLDGIREKVAKYADTEKPIGGLFFEAIQANSGGVSFFRPSFLLQVQELCKELQIPLMVDEIMAGGGRTGKMWSHMHYEGFTPDIITFGKGMQVAGVATRNGYGPQGPVTQEAVVESLLKAWVVLKTINERKLLDNATEMGKYILKRVRELGGDIAPTNDLSYSRGIGMMIWPGNVRGNVRGAEGRLFPYLNMSRQEVDEVLPKPSN